MKEASFVNLTLTSRLLLSANFSAARLMCALDPSGTVWQNLSWIKGAREADISLRFGALSSNCSKLPSPSTSTKKVL